MVVGSKRCKNAPHNLDAKVHGSRDLCPWTSPDGELTNQTPFIPFHALWETARREKRPINVKISFKKSLKSSPKED